jgi:hypothetical protein
VERTVGHAARIGTRPSFTSPKETAMTWVMNPHAPDSLGSADGNDHDEPGTEIASGVFVERRSILWLPALAAATFLFGRSRLSAADHSKEGAAPAGKKPSSTSPLDWDEFLKQCVPIAKEMFKDSSAQGQDAYLNRVASFAVRLRAAPNTKLFAFGKLNPKVEFNLSHKGFPFVVVQWRMHPRAILPAHCHPQTSVCTLGLEGETRLRNFEVHGKAPAFDSGSSQAFLIRETHSQILTPRRTSTLSPTRDNIHYFEAGADGARGIDITTAYGGTGNFSFVAFDPDKPREAQQRIFEAAWTGQEPPKRERGKKK